jgi:hypothetical protein
MDGGDGRARAFERANGRRDGDAVDHESTSASEDGSPAAPYRTITRALDRARELRFGPTPVNGTIVVHVASSATP